MVEDLDINNKEKKLEKALEFVRKGGITIHNKPSTKPITEKNIKLILDFYKLRTLRGMSLGTRFKEIHMLVNLARLLDKDFDLATKDEIKDLIFQRLPRWCRVILELKREIEKEKTKSI